MTPRLTTGHPRLWITPQALPIFRRHSTGFRRLWRQQLFKKLDTLVATPQPHDPYWETAPETVALALGQAWQLTHDEKYVRCARRLLEWLEPCVAGSGSYNAWGMAAEAAAICYDWFYDYWLAHGEAENIAEVALLCGRRALDDLLHRYILDDWHNYGLRLQSGALAVALAIGNDHPGLEDGSLLRAMHALHFTGLSYEGLHIQDLYRVPRTTLCLDAALRADGGAGFSCLWEATGGYHVIDAEAIIRMAELWSQACLPRRVVWPELTQAGHALLLTRRPDDATLVWSDSHPGAFHGRSADCLYLLHARTPQPVFAERLRHFAATGKQPLPVLPLLYATPDTLPRKSDGSRPLQSTLPKAAHIGPLVLLRSGWDANATFISLRCGLHGGWHNHLDHNSFTIFRGGSLAADPLGPPYVGPQRPEYGMRTIAHNTILVRNPREKFWLGRYGLPTVNDGGQRLVTVSYVPPNDNTGGPHAILTQERRTRFSDEFNMGRVVTFASTNDFDYVAGDATRAYTYPWSGLGTNPSRRVEEFVRQIVFLKPELIVVFDRVEATRAAFQKTWLLHTLGPASFQTGGRKLNARPGIQRLPAQGPFEFRHLRGRLTVWPLLPERRTIRSVGGRGFEAWVDGAPDSGAAGGKNFADPQEYPETAKWRLELAPAKPATRDCFLTVLHAGLADSVRARERYRFEVSSLKDEVTLQIHCDDCRTPLASLSFLRQGQIAAEVRYHGQQARYTAIAPKPVPQVPPGHGR